MSYTQNIVVIPAFAGMTKQRTFIKTASENPVLWTGLKGGSAESRKKVNQMLKQVQHDMTVRLWSFCHPELGSGIRFWV